MTLSHWDSAHDLVDQKLPHLLPSFYAQRKPYFIPPYCLMFGEKKKNQIQLSPSIGLGKPVK